MTPLGDVEKGFPQRIAFCACIDLSGPQTSFAIAAASKKHPSWSLTLREARMNPCAMAVMVTSSLPRRSKAKHIDSHTVFIGTDMHNCLCSRPSTVSDVACLLSPPFLSSQAFLISHAGPSVSGFRIGAFLSDASVRSASFSLSNWRMLSSLNLKGNGSEDPVGLRSVHSRKIIYVSFQKQHYAMGNESNETSTLERIQILLRRQPSQASIRREVLFRY